MVCLWSEITIVAYATYQARSIFSQCRQCSRLESAEPVRALSRAPRDERMGAGLEDILRFHGAYNRPPEHGEGMASSSVFTQCVLTGCEGRKIASSRCSNRSEKTWLQAFGQLANFSGQPRSGKASISSSVARLPMSQMSGQSSPREYDRKDRRVRVIYDNATETNLLARSLQKALYRDGAGRRDYQPFSWSIVWG